MNSLKVEPDYVEVLPGVASKAVSKIQQETSASVIAGGLIDEQSEIREAISMALSTSLQVTRNFGNLYTVNKNVFKFVNQGIITFS